MTDAECWVAALRTADPADPVLLCAFCDWCVENGHDHVAYVLLPFTGGEPAVPFRMLNVTFLMGVRQATLLAVWLLTDDRSLQYLSSIPAPVAPTSV